MFSFSSFGAIPPLLGKVKGKTLQIVNLKPSEKDQKSNPMIGNLKSPVLGSSATTKAPSSMKDVFLDDWWLEKAGDGEGEGLAVGGITFRERVGLSTIRSTEISERHEATIVKAKDGITFTISGFINRSRTMENGFPPEVCNRFLLGFPFDWKNYVTSCHGSPKQGITTRIYDSESNVSSGNSCQDLTDLPVTRVRDLLLSTYGDSCYSFGMDSLHQDLAGDKSSSCGGVSTKRMTRLEHKKTASPNSNNGQRLEEHALPLEKTKMKTRSGLILGVASEARSSKKKTLFNTAADQGRGRRIRKKT